MNTLPWTAIGHALEKAEPIRASGRVKRIRGLIVEGTMPGAQLGMLCHIMIDGHPGGIPAEVVALGQDTVSLMPLKSISGITTGTNIQAGTTRPSVGVSPQLIGRVLDGWGKPIDGKGAVHCFQQVPLYPEPLNPMERNPVEHPQPVGIRSVDAMLTCGQGQRLAIMAGSGVGKSTLLGMMARYSDADVKIIALVGERSREVRHFVDVDLGDEGLKRSIVVASTSGEAAAMRIRAARTATALAEYFRDQGLKVLLLMDSLTRVCMAQRELGLSTGEPPTTRGYPPSSFAIIPELLERAGPGTNEGSITGFYTVFLEGDDLNDPIGDAIRAVTDGHIVLSRRLADQGRYPAIDLLSSTSRVMSEVASKEHSSSASIIKRVLADLREAEELQELGAYQPGAVNRYDNAMALRDELVDFQVQSMNEGWSFDDGIARTMELAQAIQAQESTA
jgi:flagellum-specific ATP synthase